MKELAPGVKLTDGAMTQIVVRAAEGVEGARVRRRRRKVAVAIGEGRARVDLELAVEYGRVLPDVARDVQREVTDAVDDAARKGRDSQRSGEPAAAAHLGIHQKLTAGPETNVGVHRGEFHSRTTVTARMMPTISLSASVMVVSRTTKPMGPLLPALS